MDLVAIRVDRPKAQDLSLVAISLTAKIPAVTIEAKGSNQELVSGALSRLSHAIEAGLQFPRSNLGVWQTVGIIAGVIGIAVFDALVLALASGRSFSATSALPSYPAQSVAIVVLIDLLLLLGALWLLAPFELLPAESAPRLKRLWAVWVVPLLIAVAAAVVGGLWPR